LLHTADGRQIIDAISSMVVNLHGHSNPRIAAHRPNRDENWNMSSLPASTHDAAEELVVRLANGFHANSRISFFSDDAPRRWKSA